MATWALNIGSWHRPRTFLGAAHAQHPQALGSIHLPSWTRVFAPPAATELPPDPDLLPRHRDAAAGRPAVDAQPPHSRRQANGSPASGFNRPSEGLSEGLGEDAVGLPADGRAPSASAALFRSPGAAGAGASLTARRGARPL